MLIIFNAGTGLIWICTILQYQALLMSILEVSLVRVSFQWLLFQPSIHVLYSTIVFLKIC